jgi:hypothetical protein
MIPADQKFFREQEWCFKKYFGQVWRIEIMIKRSLVLHSISSLHTPNNYSLVLLKRVMNKLSKALIADGLSFLNVHFINESAILVERH